MSPSLIRVEVAVAGGNEVGEGPVWVDDEAQLIWVDIAKHLIQWFDPNSGLVDTLDVGSEVSAVASTSSAQLVAALPGGFALISRGGASETIASVEPDKPGNRMNDGKCDSSGRFWAGTMARDLTYGTAALYRLNLDCSVDTVLSSITLSNGIGWSPDDHVMYYIDSVTQAVDALDFDAASGNVRNRRTIIRIPQSDEMPDGLTVDADGCIWIALWGAGRVQRYTPDGREDLSIQMPASHVTNCAFGGPDLADLYITSATFGLSEEQQSRQPEAGALFRCRPGITGLPANRFAGCLR